MCNDSLNSVPAVVSKREEGFSDSPWPSILLAVNKFTTFWVVFSGDSVFKSSID